MYGKELMRAAAVALCLASLNAFAAQDFSTLSTAQLTQLRTEKMNEEDHNAFRTETQKRSMNTNAAENDASSNQKREQKKGQGGGQKRGGAQGGTGRGADLQSYIDAHREFFGAFMTDGAAAPDKRTKIAG